MTFPITRTDAERNLREKVMNSDLFTINAEDLEQALYLNITSKQVS